MTELALQHYLAVGAIMFVIGLIGFMTRRNLIVMFLCTELMFQGVAINLIAFGHYHGHLGGQAGVLAFGEPERLLGGLLRDAVAGGELVEARAVCGRHAACPRVADVRRTWPGAAQPQGLDRQRQRRQVG